MQHMIKQALEANNYRLLDKHTGLFLEKLAGQDTNIEVRLAGTLASAAVGSGHVCQPLDQVNDTFLPQDFSCITDTQSWRDNLLATSVVGEPGEKTPLILDKKNRLYLYRFYHYEQSVAQNLLDRAQGFLPVNTYLVQSVLKKLFKKQESAGQLQATILALLKPFVVISGGPGTGKTYTMARILALVQGISESPLRIALAAPTGKAAARMEEALRKAKTSLPAELADKIPESSCTLHRLLGYRPDKDDFRYNARQQLNLDMLVIDEASMIDLPMMYALLQALPQTARLILLGDRHQLASVEAGSLFSDLCQGNDSLWSKQLCEYIKTITGRGDLTGVSHAQPLADCVALLKKSYRFQDTSGIGTLAAAVNSGRWQQVTATLDRKFEDLQVEYNTGKNTDTWLHSQIVTGFQSIFLSTTVEEGFAAMERFRLLCAVRRGATGVAGINSLVEKVLVNEKILPQITSMYQGKPVIIRRNDYAMQLFNGDTGLLWNDADGTLKAWFRRPDNTLYPVTPARLPEHDTAYAITIHKSQGSEFETVLLVLPEEDNRVLSRELLYTGITRARNNLILYASKEILQAAVLQKTVRYSGLAEKLWQDFS